MRNFKLITIRNERQFRNCQEITKSFCCLIEGERLIGERRHGTEFDRATLRIISPHFE